MRTSVQKWGNSLALRIPKPPAEQAHLVTGSLVEIKVVGKMIQIEPVIPPRYELDALLEAVTPDNTHAEVDTGDPQGREVW